MRDFNFFLSDRVCIDICISGEQNGYNIPEVTPAPEVERVLSEAGAEDFRAGRGGQGEQVKRLVTDAYMCFYQSPDVRMYR